MIRTGSWRVGVLLSICWAVLASPQLVAQNLVRNPGFESQMTGWSTSAGSAVYTVTTDDVLNGTYSAQGVEPANSLGRLYQDFTGALEVGKKYKLSGWIKTQEVTGGGVALALNYVNADGWSLSGHFVMEIARPKGTTAWTYYESSWFELPDMPVDAAALWLLFDFNAGTGTAFFDDVSLIPEPDIGDFVTTWKTDNTGTSSSTSITVPMVGGPYDVDWNNDGIFEETGLNGAVTHDFGVVGIYTIRIRGDYDSIRFEDSGDKEKILSLDQWGARAWSSMAFAFQGAVNLEFPATDFPDFSATSDMSFMFWNARSANPDTSGWDTSAVRNMEGMFGLAVAANPDTSGWDTSSVTNMSYMFGNASAANPDVSSWDTSSVILMEEMFAFAGNANPDVSGWDTSLVEFMNGMFQHAYSFDQDLGAWDVTSLTNAADMLSGVTLSGLHYESLLYGWNAQVLKTGVNFSGGNSTYCSAAAIAAKDNMITSHNWVITDGGESCPPPTHGFEIDLEVINIERNPKYESHQGGMVRYMNAEYHDDFTPYEVDSAIELLNQDAQQWPVEGEEVTFTAHVRNRGTSPVTAFQWTWQIDGISVLSGNFEGFLQPGNETTLNYIWTWSAERHTVGFEVSLEEDATPANNQITDFTDALSFFALIEEGFDEKFRLNTPQVPYPKTAYMTEWLQNHVRRFNEMFEEAGAPTRVRYDRLKIIADDSNPGGCAPECHRWDGAFPEVWYTSTPDPRLGWSSYYNGSVEDIDYGLLHELGHQLGLADLYRINMGTENNKVNGWLYQKPFPSAPIGLMHGVTPIISSHTAGALTRWHGFRRGYFGQYLYDIPARNSLLIKDACEKPLVGANVEVYQKVGRVGGWEEVPDQVKFSGTTDANGLYELPNVEIDPTNFPEIETGNVLRPNPFGYISNHAENGLFLIKMFTTAEPSWKFIDITKFNEAYWGGETEASTYEIKTALVRNPIPGDQAHDQSASADVPSYSSGWCDADVSSNPNLLGNANDGDSKTSWCRDRLGPGDYWQIDLGRNMWIYRAELLTNYKGYRVEGSLTGEFTGEQDFMYREMHGVNYDGAPPGIYGFPSVHARYVRLTTELSQDWTRLYEIQLFAAQGSCDTVFSSGFESGEFVKNHQ